MRIYGLDCFSWYRAVKIVLYIHMLRFDGNKLKTTANSYYSFSFEVIITSHTCNLAEHVQ